MRNKILISVLIGLLIIGSVITLRHYSSVKRLSSVEKELKEELQKLKEAGIPTNIEELNLPEIPDEENGALVYKKAFDLIDSLKKEYKDIMDYLPYESIYKWEDVPVEKKEKVVDFVLNNVDFAEMYQLLKKASQMECLFISKKDYQTIFIKTPLSHYSKLRSCARISAAKAKIEKEHGETVKSLNTCLTGLRIGNSLSNEPTIISQLVRFAIDGIALKILEETVSEGPTEEKSTDLYQSFINEIKQNRDKNLTFYALGEETTRFKQALSEFKKEGIEALKVFLQDFSKEEQEKLTKAFQQNQEKFWDEQGITYIQTILKVVPLFEEPLWKVKNQLDNIDTELKGLPLEKSFLAKSEMKILYRTYIAETRNDAILGTAEITIANKIYKQKHGEYVDSLGQLTPEILPALPLDPFTGKDYIYKKKDKGFIVYSVGDNMKDDNGTKRTFEKDSSAYENYDIIWECSL